MVCVDGEKGRACSKTFKRVNVFISSTSSGGSPRIERDILEPCTYHMKRMTQANATHSIERTFIFFHQRVTVGGVSAGFTVPTGLFINFTNPLPRYPS